MEKTAKFSQLPQYTGGDLALFLSKLRLLVFSSQQQAADYFYLNRAQITRYETGGHTTPGIGYVAALVKLVAEQKFGGSEVQELLLIELKSVLSDHYPSHGMVQNWSTLCNQATEYIEQKRAKFVDKKISRNEVAKLPHEKKLRLFEERIGPTTYHELIGMDRELHELVTLLASPEPPWIVAVTGLGGIGKTSFVHAAVRRLIYNQAFEDIGWVSVRQTNNSFDKWRRDIQPDALSVESIFDQLLLQLVPSILKGVNVINFDSQALLKARLSEIPHLVVIDNLETLADLDGLISKLQPLTIPSKFLVTTRVNLYDEPSVFNLMLKGLHKTDGVKLLRREARYRNVSRIREVDKDVLENLSEFVGGNPLALRLAVGQAQTRAIDSILTGLVAADSNGNAKIFEFIYRDVWQGLEQQTRIVLLSMLLSTDYGLSIEYIANVSQIPSNSIRLHVERLERLNLIHGNNALVENELRYTCHSLTRIFLKNVVIQSDTLNNGTKDYSATMRSLVANSIRFFNESLIRSVKDFSSDVQDQALHSLRLGLEWPELWPMTQALLLQLAPVIEQAGYRNAWLPHLMAGIRHSKSLRQHKVEAELRFHLGTLRQRLGNYQLANQEFRLSAQLFDQLGDSVNQAKSLNRRAYVARLQRKFTDANFWASQSLCLLPSGHSERAYSLLVVGTVALDKRSYALAVDYFRDAISIWTSKNEQRMVAWCLTNLGAALRPLERHSEAVEVYQTAITYFEQEDDPVHLASASMNLGNVHLSLSEPQKALTQYHKAFKIFVRFEEQLRQAHVQMNMGLAHLQLEQWVQAEKFLRNCSEIYISIGNVERAANAMDALGQTYACQNRYEEANATLERGLSLLDGQEFQSHFEPIRTNLEIQLKKIASMRGHEQCATESPN